MNDFFITKTCYNCKKKFKIYVDKDNYLRYKDNKLSFNETFAHVDDDIYELLLKGICADCLDELY
jgi:hypothetical protein